MDNFGKEDENNDSTSHEEKDNFGCDCFNILPERTLNLTIRHDIEVIEKPSSSLMCLLFGTIIFANIILIIDVLQKKSWLVHIFNL